MPETPVITTKTALLTGAALLLMVTGCTQDDREYLKVPAGRDLAWYVPEEIPGWYSDSEYWDDSASYSGDECDLRLAYTEEQADAPRYTAPEERARNWIGLTAMQLGSDLPAATVTTLDPVEVTTDTGELVEFTTVETFDEEADIGARVGVHWNGSDELRFLYQCATSGSWSNEEGDMSDLLDEMRVMLP